MPSKHPSISTLPPGFFSGLQRFRELEERIAALPNGSLQRGDALEIFVEAYLQTHPIFQVDELWLVNQIPLPIRQQLKLPNDGKGIDGIYRRRDGTLAPYQVKFRQGRPQVGVGDTASFFMLTEGAAQRVLISNSDRYAKEIQDRDDLLIIGGSSFDELTAEDLVRIECWINGKVPTVRRERALRPDQAQAVEAITKHLQLSTRATAVMPCGTGKTLVGLRVVESLQPRTVIVFVPSLALLAQLLEDWAKDTVWGSKFRYLCVCSQSSVSAEVDRWELCPTDVHFPVTTDPGIVRKFLDQNNAESTVRVVFSTYQSARKVAEGLPDGFRFDVGVFDEAHKTTEGGFGLALADEEIPIQRRIFLTATPRHIDIRRRDKEGDFKIVSMDDPDIYGQRAYVQSFAEAVSLGIICDYRIVVSVVDRTEISEYAERHGITLVQGDAHSTRWVASQIAVTKAIQETGASKLITFHSRVHQAKEFASQTPRGIAQFLPDFRVGHVNGTQPVTDRKSVLRGFLDEGKMLVSNARCLTEGVDLPAVDAVVFNNPRRSKVDIVQAMGRAMRKPPLSKKELGYVVIPVLLGQNQTEDIEEACRGTEWEDFVAVVAALRDQDPRIEEMIREAQETKGRSGVFDPQIFGERIAILGRPEIPLHAIQSHISSLILERLGQSWDYRYGELMAYKEKHGHCRVTQTENLPLAFWVVMQRQKFKKGILSKERKARLDALEFVWDQFAAQWDEKYLQLQAFHSKHQHCRIPSNYPNSGLNYWIAKQRKTHREGNLSTTQIDRLNALGFEWNPFEESFEELCAQLQKFKLLYGHSNVPARSEDFKWLGEKLSKLREYYRKHDPNDSRAKRLIELGVVLEPHKERFQLNYRRLMDFKQRHGHCNVTDDLTENKQLARWVTNLRSRKRKGRLDPTEISKLDTLGFDWDPKKAAVMVWHLRVSELRSYIQQHGNSHVPINYERNPELGNWWRNIRSSRNSGKLAQTKEKELNSLGVIWNTDAGKWLAMFEQLKIYKVEKGDCNVPCKYPNNPKLGRWVHTQRNQRKNGELSAERVKILTSIGFWDYSSKKQTPPGKGGV
jgi:superfamily II DNA or RNA helicase